jgi:hypothetical protein
MHLKKAREQNKLGDFIDEKEKTHPKGSHLHFHGVIKSMAGQKSKPKKGTSK